MCISMKYHARPEPSVDTIIIIMIRRYYTVIAQTYPRYYNMWFVYKNAILLIAIYKINIKTIRFMLLFLYTLHVCISVYYNCDLSWCHLWYTSLAVLAMPNCVEQLIISSYHPFGYQLFYNDQLIWHSCTKFSGLVF